jgi:nicotinamide riboside kinase
MIKFIFVGSESTGKTTMCKICAEYYKIPWTEEACRIFAERAGTLDEVLEGFGFNLENFIEMSKLHNNNEIDTTAKAIICDNDSFAVGIWCERYLGPSVENSKILDGLYEEILKHDEEHKNKRIYILFKPNVPFVQDGYRDGEHIREWMYHRFIEEFSRRRISYYVIDQCDFSLREEQVKDIINLYK